jgi:hypothetical protein
MTNIRNQKDTLAKLMATENLTVVHKKIPTAYFDIKNRILACPILKDDISPELYDLFMGHEVGHALHTPAEGLHNALESNRTLKGYLNVVEDIRIERKIREKYQGLRKSFYAAYNELMEMDFFGLAKRDLQELSLIDKVNLITKVGSRVNIKLNAKETVLLNQALAADTWDEVVVSATAIYEFSKENETRTEDDEALVPQTVIDYDDEDGEQDDADGDSWGDGEENEDDSEESSATNGGDEENDSLPDMDESDSNDIEGESPSKEQDDLEDENQAPKMTGGKQGGYQGEHDDQNGARESITEHAAHNNEEQFVSESNKIVTQIDLTKMFKTQAKVINQCEVSFKTVLQDWNNYFNLEESKLNTDIGLGQKIGAIRAKNLVDKNKKLVSHMAKEFDMRQTAAVSKHAYTGKTGKLDMNRLSQYQIVDDVFKRAVYLPEGQNHGVNILLDWSGSIAAEAADLLEQSIILAMFCRKVNIPHRVYLFTDSYNFTQRSYDNEDVNLVTIASDEMNNKQWSEMLTYLGCLYNNFWIDAFSYRNRDDLTTQYNELFGEVNFIEYDYFWHNTTIMPKGYRLGGTPLNQSLVVLRKMLPIFNAKYKVEKSILTIITDGYSHSGSLLKQTEEESDAVAEQQTPGEYSYRSDQWRQIIDPYTRKVYPFSGVEGYGRGDFLKTQNLLDWLSKECSVSVTGYFVVSKKNEMVGLMQEIESRADYNEVWKQTKKNGSVHKCHGYGKLFITAASALAITGDDELGDEFIDAKKVKVMAAFKRNQKSKTTSRFLTNEFIKEIA